MAIDTNLKYAGLDELYLDPINPRLGRHRMNRATSQDQLLEWMSEWTLDELAISYLESDGFWTNEALLVVNEELYGQKRLVVVEGNRRLAALKYLYSAYQDKAVSRKWVSIAQSASPTPDLFSRIPYLSADSREDVQAFLGFRHATGIKPWDADEKAGFIAKLIDEQGFTYEQVMRKIGSKIPTVRQHYIAYRLLLQIEDSVEEFKPEYAENRFAILYMSMQTEGAKHYLQIDVMAEPELAKRPVPNEHLKNLANFALWLFGNHEVRALVTDTRDVGRFGKILQNKDAVEYLERSAEPKFEVALRIAGGDSEEIVRLIQQAADNLEVALSTVHQYKDSLEVQKEVQRLGIDALQLLSIFPQIKQKLQ